MINNVQIGETIKQYREKKKITQRDLATKISRTESSIRKYENGSIEIPLSVLDEISIALDVPVLDLVSSGIKNNFDNSNEKSDEKLDFYENLCHLYFKGVMTWSKDRLITDIEDSIKIQAHLSELLLRYKKLIENYVGHVYEITRSMDDNEEFNKISEEGKLIYMEEALTNALERDMEEMAMWIKMFAMKVTRPL